MERFFRTVFSRNASHVSILKKYCVTPATVRKDFCEICRKLHRKCAKRISRVLAWGFDSRETLFHTLFNSSVENFNRALTIFSVTAIVWKANCHPAIRRLRQLRTERTSGIPRSLHNFPQRSSMV
jgi:hypothetical protein